MTRRYSPEFIMTGEGPYDIQGQNRAPRKFKGRLGEFPRIMEYGGKVDALRRRYKDRLWDVVFNSTQGAIVVIER